MKSKNLVVAITTMLLFGLLVVPASAGSDWLQFQGGADKNACTDEDGPLSVSSSWETHLYGGGWMGMDSVPLVVDDYVYAKSYNPSLYRFSLAGSKTTVNSTGGGGLQNAVSASNGSVIFDLSTGYMNQFPTIKAIDLSTDNVIWTATFGDSVSYQCSCPILYDDGYLYVGNTRMSGGDSTNLTDDGSYYCFDENGNEIWSTPSSDNVGYYWAGACSVGEYIVYGNDAGNVTLVEKADGDVVDSFDISDVFSDDNQIRSTCVYYDDGTDERIYFTSKGGIYYVGLTNNGGTYSFDTSSTGSNTGISSSTSTPAIDIDEGVVYVCGTSGLYALDADDLTTTWTHAGGASKASPVISDDLDDGDNVIYYVTGLDSICYGVRDDGNSYTELFDYPPTNDNYGLQGVAISGGMIFYGNDDGYLFGIE
jgi:outer membrane protein assembly factor BamB